MIYEPVKKDEGENGIQHLFSGKLNLTVVPTGDQKARVFVRNAVRFNPPPGVPERTRWLVGELKGVRVYTDGDSIIVTTRDLNP